MARARQQSREATPSRRLLVEDEGQVLESVRRQLEASGYEMLTGSDGEAGKERFVALFS